MKNQGFIQNNAQLSSKENEGNAFIIVLILIALLAALTLTLTRMGNNTNDVSQEQATVIASQVLRQARTVANGVDGLIAKGCSITQLSFEGATTTGITAYINAQSPADKSCWLFNSNGAGLTPPSPVKDANTGTEYSFMRNGVNGVGPERETSANCTSQCVDLLMVVPFVNINVCKALNVLTGVTNSFSTAPPVNSGSKRITLYYKFYAASSAAIDTNFSAGDGAETTRIDSPTLYGKKAGCLESAAYADYNASSQSVPGSYFFYYVLYEK